MTYQGYTARVEFDERDNILVGRVLGVKAIIDFHGETVAELRADFKAAIDLLLDDCKARGEAPEKPASGKMMLRVPPDVHGAALVAAALPFASPLQSTGMGVPEQTQSVPYISFAVVLSPSSQSVPGRVLPPGTPRQSMSIPSQAQAADQVSLAVLVLLF